MSRPIFGLLDLHAAWVAGWEQGRAERVELALEDAEHARLHRHAVDIGRQSWWFDDLDDGELDDGERQAS